MKRFLWLMLVMSGALRAAEVKKASEVFKKWLDIQKIYDTIDFAAQANFLAEQYTDFTLYTYEHHMPSLRNYGLPMLSGITLDAINEYGHEVKNREAIERHAADLFTMTEHNFPALVELLQSWFSKRSLLKDKTIDTHDQTTLYRLFAALIWGQPCLSSPNNLHFLEIQQGRLVAQVDNDVLFSVANKAVEFLFDEKNAPLVQKIFTNTEYQDVAAFLLSLIQHHFSGIGWHNWSKSCLDNLKKSYDQGKRITYLAGGSDIYQLIKHGIYNIKIVDPQLPSQPKYYADEWSWLMRGAGPQNGLGDQLYFEEEGIVLTRMSYHEEATTFQACLADGQVIAIQPSKTIWMVATKQGKPLGSYALERRFVTQDDFTVKASESLLLSFNELFFIAMPDELLGWKIVPSKFSPDITLFVKQLHQPINKAAVCSLRTTALFNAFDVKFIHLGSCIN